MKQAMILSYLLDKYEKSKHLLAPGTSTRRVTLRIDKKELPEYHYQDAAVRDAFNEAAVQLEEAGLISIEWVKDRPVLSCLILNLDAVLPCYQRIGRVHPRELAATVESMVQEALSSVSTDWIAAWQEEVCSQAKAQFRIPSFCKKDLTVLSDLLTAFAIYDGLQNEPITMRAFSSKCYHDTKYFERHIRDLFLRIAAKYNTGLAEACTRSPLKQREQLAYLGIYARPELYELSGNCSITTGSGTISVAAAAPFGLAFPSTFVDSIVTMDLSNIHQIIFIENKTNYDEYILSELTGSDLVVYHGGFLSPQKRKFFSKIAESMVPGTAVYFWADIDLGGFQMFDGLQRLIPSVLPMRMSGHDVADHYEHGLARSAEYLEQLQAALDQGTYPLFDAAIREILKYGVTIEQETFLSP